MIGLCILYVYHETGTMVSPMSMLLSQSALLRFTGSNVYIRST